MEQGPDLGPDLIGPETLYEDNLFACKKLISETLVGSAELC